LTVDRQQSTVNNGGGMILMDILIESTKDFEKDLEKFTNTEKFNLIKELNRYLELLSTDKNLFYQYSEQLRNIKLNKSYDSSIYSLKINQSQRIILAIDDDPIFNSILITLFRLINAEEAQQAYNAVAESIYQDFTVEENPGIGVASC
jgi:Txe/YoeB family toxin of Txe-Axe toxin-antitoxin module